MTEPVWYAEGLRFTCTQCGNCCSGEPGVVWVSPEDMQQIAEFTGLTETELRLKHTKRIGGKVTLRERENGDCTFLDANTRGCTIYSVRPAQCRTWPFWNSNLESPETWEEAKSGCPGMGKGKLYSLEKIRQQADVVDI